ncbi:MAG: ATP-binding cassette domain-containing protein [bacterium]|nr:ATP-binding cassette domain-containing protein [bacterium]
MTAERDILLDVRNLAVDYRTGSGILGGRRGHVRVLENISLRLRRGETLGVVGESGCGKSTLAMALARFVIASHGDILFDGRDVLRLDAAGLRAWRRDMQLVFQSPQASLNPRMTVHSIVSEPLVTHTRLDRGERRQRVEELLGETGLDPSFLSRYPHELSGGQAQRVVLARALALNPLLLVLDEPTSALDVSVQAQILNLLMRLQAQHNLTYMLISHSLGVVEHVSDRIAVLYLGEIVEEGPRDEVFRQPRHPYTQALMAATPVVDPSKRQVHRPLSGMIPGPASRPTGCRFHTRCPRAWSLCRDTRPRPQRVGDGHVAACHLLTS